MCFWPTGDNLSTLILFTDCRESHRVSKPDMEMMILRKVSFIFVLKAKIA